MSEKPKNNGILMEKLAHPPIEQAAIEVIVDLPAGRVFADLERVAKVLASDYPKKTDISRQAVQVELTHKQAPKSHFEDLGQFGWQLNSADGRRGIQVRLDGVLMTQTGEYEDWEACYGDFDKVVSAYYEALTPKTVRRASSRFINRLAIKPGAPTPIEDMLRIPLPLPSGFDDVKVANMISRVTFKDPETGLQGTVILMADGVQPALVLDIDVADLEPGSLTTDELKARFGRLREFKNRIFQNSLTTRQLEVYK